MNTSQYICTFPVGPDDRCFGKSEDTAAAKQDNSNKATVSTDDTTCNITCNAGDIVSDIVTDVGDSHSTVNDIAGPSLACAVSDVIASAPGEDRTTNSTPSDTVSDMSSDISRDNQANNKTEGDTKSNKLEETHSGETNDDIRGVMPGDIITNTKIEVDATSNTTCDKEADTKSDALSDGIAPESKASQQAQHTLESEGLNQKLDTSSDRTLDTEVSSLKDIEGDKPNDERADVAAAHTSKRTHTGNHSPTCTTTDVKGEGRVDGESDVSTSEIVDTKGDPSSDKTAGVNSIVCAEHSTLVTKRTHTEDTSGDKTMDVEGDASDDKRANIGDTSGNKRTDIVDRSGDKRTDIEGGKRTDIGDTSGDKRTGIKGDTSGDKRTDTEGDTSNNKRTDTGEDVTDKETRSIGTTTKEDTINNQRTIIDVYRKRMKQNGSGHKLKFLRPELVKAFIQ